MDANQAIQIIELLDEIQTGVTVLCFMCGSILGLEIGLAVLKP